MATEMPLHTVYDTATIRAVTQECQQEFRTCAEVPALTEKHWAENRLADFNLWGAWVGASAEEPNSLELHLYHDSEAQKVVISTLSILIAWLRKCKEVAETQRTGSQPPAAASDSNAIPTRTNTSDGHETPIGLQEAKKSVGDILAALIDLGIAIGHDVGGVPSRFTAADRALEEQADGSLYLELTEHLKFVLSSAKIPRIATRSNEALMRRTSYQELAVPKSWAVVGDVSHEQLILLKANIKRHNRFVYAQKREVSLKVLQVQADTS
ncbi:uncharacterized protein J4E79_007847 [Alternaria viburni]|uniref:uncharacterized protein n=1 Tax=Alternaria viburni TaxID=566460 RepID=UPI0020C3957E|nr:uncharacterized protein J4E79_007847 [Alternaria viburni]KAI4657230.1 hypothetical protein J4E79_007847 [Alternaria viburni]